MRINGVEIINEAECSAEEVLTCLEQAKKESEGTLRSITIKAELDADGNPTDNLSVEYEQEVKFERIRRITGL